MAGLNRRALTAGVFAASVLRPAWAQANDVDVVVIGAGAAGYGAARELRKQGLTFMIIEARDRLGGRVFTDRSLGEPFDAGAQFIHWSDRNPWREIASELGVQTTNEGRRTAFLSFRDGHQTSDDERQRRRAAYQAFSALTDTVDPHDEDKSFADLVAGKNADIRAAAQGLSLFALGEDPQFTSSAEYAELWWGGDLMAPEGYGALVARALSTVPVSLSTPAKLVRWNGRGVSVETDRGTIRAATAIVTPSVGVLQAGAIRFEPALPRATLLALDGLRMGALTKIALRFDGDRLGLTNGTDLFDIGAETGAQMSAEAWLFDRNLIVAVMGGAHARAIIKAGEAAAVDHALSRVATMIGVDARKHFKDGRLAGWAGDPFALGSYSLAKPGRFASREALAKPVGDRIWFAGEATAGGGAMTAGGATLSGERAAREIAAMLQKRRG